MALSPDDVLYLDTSRRRVKDSYAIGTQQNDYQRRLGEQDYRLRYANALNQWNKAGNRLTPSFARRGLMNSGIFQRGLGDFFKDRTSNLGEMEQRQQLAREGFVLNQSQLDRIRQGATSDLDLQEQRRAAIADALRSL